MRFCYLSGISPRFQELSQSSWAGCLCITHPFASRSNKQAYSVSIDLHVLGTPPAFILSQDQTLHLIDSISSGSLVRLFNIICLTFCCVLISCSVFKDLLPLSYRVLDDNIICAMSCQHLFFTFFRLPFQTVRNGFSRSVSII